MSLATLLGDSNYSVQKQGMSEERVRAQLDNLRKLFSFFREYPDLFIDFIKGKDCNFKFYTYQRVFLRQVMRYRYVYATYPRAFSKSFLSIMALMLKAILYPGCELFITTGGKEQAASITIAKVEEICKLIPALYHEIDWERGKSRKTTDFVEYQFKNGSKINILPAKESSRGQRRTAGLMEECVLIDQKALNEIVIPTTNVDRLLPDGTRHKEEIINKSQTYITTAGYKNTFAFDKLIELLIQSIIDPHLVSVMGGTYETPVAEGLIADDFVTQLKLQGTFDESSFDREYRSKWGGDALNAFFSAEKFDKYRVLLAAETAASGRISKQGYYVIGVDVGRLGCTTEATVIKVTPQPQGASLKSVVYIYTYESEDFETQAIHLKQLFYKYKARRLVIDANGLGVGLVDFMIKSQIDPDTGDTLPPFGVDNDDKGEYKKYKTPDTVQNAMYLVKANAPINTEAYGYMQTQISSGKVKFLIDDRFAKTKLMETKVGQNMSVEQRAEYLKPFVATSILREQILNLVQENEGVNIILKQANKKILKDKFSSFIYGLYYIKQEEDRKRKRRGRDMSSFMFFA